MPPGLWIVAAIMALIMIVLCVATARAVLRPAARIRISAWPISRVVILVLLATIPWLVVQYAPLTIKVSIHGTLQLVGWLCLGLVVFALLVLLPLAVVVSAGVWATARRRARVARH
jgi:hypothetical protein